MTARRSLEAELLRGVLSATAHDLGGLASALALRVDVLERSAPSDASAALRRIADELRTLGHDVRSLRGSEGGDTLSPTRSGSLVQWLTRLLRYGRPMLPRGSTVSGDAPDSAVVESDASHELMYIALAVLRHVAFAGDAQRVEVGVNVQTRDANAVITISAIASGNRLSLPNDATEEWWQWALARANACGIPMNIEDGHVVLTVPLLQRA